MVGECATRKRSRWAVEASLTGHLVFSTLHTNSAPESIIRLLDMGMDPFNFADALLGILAQRLAKKLCDCKEEYTPDADEVKLFVTEYAEELRHSSAWKVRLRRRGQEALRQLGQGHGQDGRLKFYKAVAASSATRPATRAVSACTSADRG